MTLETNRSNHQWITYLSLKEFINFCHSENRKQFSETQLIMEITNPYVKCWDGIGSEGRQRLEVPVGLHSHILGRIQKEPVHVSGYVLTLVEIGVLTQSGKVSGNIYGVRGRKGKLQKPVKNNWSWNRVTIVVESIDGTIYLWRLTKTTCGDPDIPTNVTCSKLLPV